MAQRGFIKTLTAEGDIEKGRCLTFGADRHHFKQAGAGDFVAGIADFCAKDGDTVDAIMSDIPDVAQGGVIPFGAPLKSDADGKAIVAVAGDLAFGFSMVDGIADTALEPGGEVFMGHFTVA